MTRAKRRNRGAALRKCRRRPYRLAKCKPDSRDFHASAARPASRRRAHSCVEMMAYFMEKHAADRHVARPLQPTEIFWTYRAARSTTISITRRYRPNLGDMPKTIPARSRLFRRTFGVSAVAESVNTTAARPLICPSERDDSNRSTVGRTQCGGGFAIASRTATIDSARYRRAFQPRAAPPTSNENQLLTRRSSAAAAVGLPPFKTSIDL